MRRKKRIIIIIIIRRRKRINNRYDNNSSRRNGGINYTFSESARDFLRNGGGPGSLTGPSGPSVTFALNFANVLYGPPYNNNVHFSMGGGRPWDGVNEGSTLVSV